MYEIVDMSSREMIAAEHITRTESASVFERNAWQDCKQPYHIQNKNNDWRLSAC